jgi:hypothetical protein
MNRLERATEIMQGICAGDWKMEIPEGKTWDDVAIARAFEIADKMDLYDGNYQEREEI